MNAATEVGSAPTSWIRLSEIGPYRHGPQPPQVAFEWVQAVAGEIQSLRRCGRIENREDSLNRIQEVGADPTSVPRS